MNNIHISLLSKVISNIAKRNAAKLNELKERASDMDRPDFLWHALLEALSTLGNSRGYETLILNNNNYKRVTFEAIQALPSTQRYSVVETTLLGAKVRMPRKKAQWIMENFERVVRLGGPEKATKKLLSAPGKDGKINFLKMFSGIGDKYARNIFMVVYHPDFQNSIAVDDRIKKISACLGLHFLSYHDHEKFYLSVANKSDLNGWEVDRILYHFKDEVLLQISNRTEHDG